MKWHVRAILQRMSLLQNTREELNARRGDWPAVAEATGLSYSWVCKFARGRYRNPGIAHVQALADHFAANPRPQSKRAPA